MIRKTRLTTDRDGRCIEVGFLDFNGRTMGIAWRLRRGAAWYADLLKGVPQ